MTAIKIEKANVIRRINPSISFLYLKGLPILRVIITLPNKILGSEKEEKPK